MERIEVKREDLDYAPTSYLDPVGKVFFHNDKVYRIIYDQSFADQYKQLLADDTNGTLVKSGLISSKIAEDIYINGIPLIIEHEKVPYILHPCEMTSEMFWDCAVTFCDLSIELAKKSLALKDGHPWNMSFYKGRPVFLDFCSIVNGSRISPEFHEEFIRYFIIPICLASSNFSFLNKLAPLYRKDFGNMFSIQLLKNSLIRRFLLFGFYRSCAGLGSTSGYFESIKKWLHKNKPNQSQNGIWESYTQANENPDIKAIFTESVLKKHTPKSVIDLAGNKGFFSLMAASYGASVVCCDYEEKPIDELYKTIRSKDICVTPAIIDFKFPTQAFDWGLKWANSFDRLRSEIAICLGLIHHVCINQSFPVKLFIETCALYSKKGVILEYIYPEDKYVSEWKAQIPEDYTVKHIEKYMSAYFQHVEMSEVDTTGGIKRQYFFFYNS